MRMYSAGSEVPWRVPRGTRHMRTVLVLTVGT